jgi:hypothetical protein
MQIKNRQAWHAPSARATQLLGEQPRHAGGLGKTAVGPSRPCPDRRGAAGGCDADGPSRHNRYDCHAESACPQLAVGGSRWFTRIGAPPRCAYGAHDRTGLPHVHRVRRRRHAEWIDRSWQYRRARLRGPRRGHVPLLPQALARGGADSAGRWLRSRQCCAKIITSS